MTRLDHRARPLGAKAFHPVTPIGVGQLGPVSLRVLPDIMILHGPYSSTSFAPRPRPKQGPNSELGAPTLPSLQPTVTAHSSPSKNARRRWTSTLTQEANLGDTQPQGRSRSRIEDAGQAFTSTHCHLNVGCAAHDPARHDRRRKRHGDMTMAIDRDAANLPAQGKGGVHHLSACG